LSRRKATRTRFNQMTVATHLTASSIGLLTSSTVDVRGASFAIRTRSIMRSDKANQMLDVIGVLLVALAGLGGVALVVGWWLK
jgi:hypothetical protein